MQRADPDQSAEPDDHVVRALLHDLDAGFVELFETYRHVVFAVALKMCGRWAEAEDLTAESFLRAYRALSGYRRARIMALKPRSWLVTIALNLWRNQQRDAARRPTWDPRESPPDAPDEVSDVEREVTRRETDRELAALLTELPDEQRTAIVLRHVVDLPVAEIAGVLGRPEGTVKSDIARGLRRLRDLYPTLPGSHRARSDAPPAMRKALRAAVSCRAPTDENSGRS